MEERQIHATIQPSLLANVTTTFVLALSAQILRAQSRGVDDKSRTTYAGVSASYVSYASWPGPPYATSFGPPDRWSHENPANQAPE